MSRNRAVFLDRDGTLVYPRHYPTRPEELVLYPGLVPTLWRLQRAGFKLIVVTNQSGLARGLFTEADLRRLHDHLARSLERDAVRLDAIYACPHHPDGVVPELAIQCACRKPAPGMLLQAAADHDIDLARSWFIGDILDDVEAGARAGTRTILVDLGTESAPQSALREPDYVARDTRHALQMIAALEGLSRNAPETTYLPATWRTDARRMAQ